MVRCIETIYVSIWRRVVFMSVVVTVWSYVGMFVVYRPLLKKMVDFFSLGVLYVCIVTRAAVGARVWGV